MKTTLTIVSLLCAAMLTTGCEDKTAQPKPADKPAHTHEHKPGEADHHDHKEGDGHDHDHEDHGPSTELGSKTIGELTFAVSGADLVAGKEGHIEVKVTGDASKLTALRLWVGTADAKGALKAKADKESTGFHCHVDVPSPLPTGAALWFEAEFEGQTSPQVFDLPLPK